MKVRYLSRSISGSSLTAGGKERNSVHICIHIFISQKRNVLVLLSSKEKEEEPFCLFFMVVIHPERNERTTNKQREREKECKGEA